MTNTSPVRPATIADLTALVGRELGPTPWRPVPQATIDAFAEISGDHQWIHVDADRASRSQFGSTIAHGLFTLSLGPALSDELFSTDHLAHTLNYGYEKVRFPSPVPVGSLLRMRAVVESVNPLGTGSAHMITRQTFERQGSAKPVCVAFAASRCFE